MGVLFNARLSLGSIFSKNTNFLSKVRGLGSSYKFFFFFSLSLLFINLQKGVPLYTTMDGAVSGSNLDISVVQSNYIDSEAGATAEEVIGEAELFRRLVGASPHRTPNVPKAFNRNSTPGWAATSVASNSPYEEVTLTISRAVDLVVGGPVAIEVVTPQGALFVTRAIMSDSPAWQESVIIHVPVATPEVLDPMLLLTFNLKRDHVTLGSGTLPVSAGMLGGGSWSSSIPLATGALFLSLTSGRLAALSVNSTQQPFHTSSSISQERPFQRQSTPELPPVFASAVTTSIGYQDPPPPPPPPAPAPEHQTLKASPRLSPQRGAPTEGTSFAACAAEVELALWKEKVVRLEGMLADARKYKLLHAELLNEQRRNEVEAQDAKLISLSVEMVDVREALAASEARNTEIELERDQALAIQVEQKAHFTAREESLLQAAEDAEARLDSIKAHTASELIEIERERGVMHKVSTECMRAMMEMEQAHERTARRMLIAERGSLMQTEAVACLQEKVDLSQASVKNSILDERRSCDDALVAMRAMYESQLRDAATRNATQVRTMQQEHTEEIRLLHERMNESQRQRQLIDEEHAVYTKKTHSDEVVRLQDQLQRVTAEHQQLQNTHAVAVKQYRNQVGSKDIELEVFIFFWEGVQFFFLRGEPAPASTDER